MHTPRATVIDRIRRWLTDEDLIDRLLSDVENDRAFVTEVAYGICRWRLQLDWMIDRFCRKPPAPLLRAALLTGLYQLFHMDTVEPYAAVNETVEGLRPWGGEKATGFVNAVLRRALREREAIIRELEAQPASVRYSHPTVLLNRWKKLLGPESIPALCEWNNRRADVIIRRRNQGVSPETFTQHLQAAGIKTRVHDIGNGEWLILPRGVPITQLPGFDDGWFSVQDPATKTAVDLLDPQPHDRVLDACAAPGGKTALIADRVGTSTTIIAMDSNRQRLKQLHANVARLKLNVTVAEGDITQPPEAVAFGNFDRILLDVPCTNTGVLRRRPDARWRFSEAQLSVMTQLQESMLTAAAGLLAPGGVLVYSTCSLEPEENELLVTRWSQQHHFELESSRQQVPPASGCDGAYAARLVRANA